MDSLSGDVDGSRWIRIASAPAAIVSSDRNGGFILALIARYTTGNSRESSAHADYDTFEYTGYSSIGIH
ncbi:hypothetical protein [Paenibacillus lautus]|uniref:beta-xylosidase family glycoside hydrolase n=1 Tax=Paenibacillus lautus TaxID=1401 RepID=UPI000FDA6B8E|nr:hypothetical protein [Paenibacillus lautus]